MLKNQKKFIKLEYAHDTSIAISNILSKGNTFNIYKQKKELIKIPFDFDKI